MTTRFAGLSPRQTGPPQLETTHQTNTEMADELTRTYPGVELFTSSIITTGPAGVSTVSMPFFSGSEISVPVALTSTVTMTIDPSGTEASSSAQALQTGLVGLVPVLQAFLENPVPNKATEALKAIETVKPAAQGLFQQVATGSRSGSQTTCQPSTNLLEDILGSASCVVGQLEKVEISIETSMNDGFKNVKDIEKPVLNLVNLASGGARSGADSPGEAPHNPSGNPPVDPPDDSPGGGAYIPPPVPVGNPPAPEINNPPANPTENAAGGQPTSQPTKPLIDPPADAPGDETTVPPGVLTANPPAQQTDHPPANPSVDPTANPPDVPIVGPPVDPTTKPPGNPTIEPTGDAPGPPTANPPGDPTTNPPGDPTTQPTGDAPDAPTANPP
ncbi:MAG: hypothetical protein M1817_000735, partial [Caeruleum heppii]